MISTYCGSMTQGQFKKHIAECGVCWQDATERIDLDFDPNDVPNPYPSEPETKNYRVIYTVNVTAKTEDEARNKAAVLWENEVDSVDTEVEEVQS